MIRGPGGNGQHRGSLRVGQTVDVIQKADQRSGKTTRGIVQEVLTNSLTHPHGIKVRLKDGRVGRVTAIIDPAVPDDDGH